MNVPALDSSASDSLLLLAFALLLIAPLAIAGVALINTGLGRSRSAAQSLLGSIAIAAVSVIGFAVLGSVFAGSARSVAIHAAGRDWDVLGLGPWIFRGATTATPQTQLGLLFECMAAGMAALIPWGAGADRLRLAAGCAIAVVLAVILFPMLAHWVWGGGWLAGLHSNFDADAGFVDTAGASVVHVLGGLSALAVIWITGPRKGKFPREGLATAMPGHNAVYVLFGCFVALVGWLAWNAAGAILWVRAPASALPLTAINTLLSASAALVATLAVTRLRFGKPDASLCANGWLAGLVTSSACAAVVSPGAAFFTGAVTGIFTPLLVEVLELALSIDDPSGAIGVHLVSGLWGLAAAGLFAPQKGQLIAQLLGIAALMGFFLPLVYALFALLNRMVAFRVDADGERLGMDLHELGGGAYPEFVIHRDESYR
jgi:Amt family ammonium transporter